MKHQMERMQFTGVCSLVICFGLITWCAVAAESPTPRTTLEAHQAAWSVAFSPDGKTLVSGGGDDLGKVGEIMLWDTSTGKSVATLQEDRNSFGPVAFSPDGKLLASASWGTVKLWDVGSRKVTASLKGHQANVSTIAFSPDGRILASGAGSPMSVELELWDVKTGKNIASLKGHKGFVTAVAFSPDGKTLASGSHDETIKLWDVATGKNTSTLQGHTGTVRSVTFSPDGKSLASCGGIRPADPKRGPILGDIKLWDMKTAKNTATFKGINAEVYSVAFSPDGKTLASGDMDQMVRLWDIGNAKNIVTLKGHNHYITFVAFSPDGKTLATGGAFEKTIKLWDVPSLQVK